MSKDRLTHSGSSQNLREHKEGRSQDQIHIDSSPSPLQPVSQNQQLRGGGTDETNHYRSEEHRHIYQNQSQSFNEQRSAYTEQAFNEYVPPVQDPDPIIKVPSYDYQSFSPPEESGPDYRRYIAGNGVNAGADSIFASSDLDLANATGNYLPKDSEKFGEMIDQLNQKASKTAEKIGHIEAKGLKYRNSYKPWKHRLIMEPKDGLKYRNSCRPWETRLIMDSEKGRRIQRKVWHSREGKAFDRIHVEKKKRIVGRLKFQSEKIALTGKKHNREVRRQERKSTRGQMLRRQLYGDLRNAASGSEFEEDEFPTEMRRRTKHAAGAYGFYLKRKYRKLKHELDGYNRLKFQKARLDALKAQKERLYYKSGIDLQKRKAEEAARQGLIREKQKRKVKKELVQNYKREQGNFITRTRNQHKLKKTVKKERTAAKKRVRTMISSISSLVIFLLLGILMIFTFITVFLNIGGESVANTVSQNDYYDMTEVTAYFREKEAELEEYIQPENLEPIILEEYPEIFEFIYDMDEISFDANTLVAYLSAKYNEFDLEMVKADIDEIFEQYYTMEWEVKEEYRLLPDHSQAPDPDTGEYPMVNTMVQICYVTLKKEDFYELLQSRIEDAAKQNQMNGFYLAGNGQQVYGPVMNVDWRKKISSNYGWRIHPITGKRTFHDGVDIAVPVGTALYSAVKGTVKRSFYSDSGGNMITIENDSGWQITFMHMDSRTVSAGQRIEQGQLVGYSGNTGNSTGPHLHIRVHDADDQPVNPVFIIPFSTDEASETYKKGDRMKK